MKRVRKCESTVAVGKGFKGKNEKDTESDHPSDTGSALTVLYI